MSLTEEAKRKRNEYRREWNKKNPDKLKQYQENYWNKQAELAKGERAPLM